MTKRNFNFQKLTPTNKANIEIYSEAIDFVFKDAELKNIALSGAFGAGKSSVIESYKSKNRRKKFMNISLAYFEPSDNEKVDSSGGKKEESAQTTKENVLEGKILNQLIDLSDN